MTLLIQELNEIYQQSPNITIYGWNERESKAFNIKIDMRSNKIDDMIGIPNNTFAQLLWYAGIYKLEEDQAFKEFETYLKHKSVCPKSIAIDTNVILNRYLVNYGKQRLQAIHDRFQAIIVVAQASSHEFHYKAGFLLKNEKSMYNDFSNYVLSNLPLAKLLTQSNNPDIIKSRLKLIKSYDGRLGLKGQLELRELQRNLPVLLTKSTHLYYGAALQMERNVDALFDSLIRVEINQMTNVTNMELLFLTSDKDQHEAATTEGVNSIYIKPPSNWMDLLDPSPQNLNLENLSFLLLELLFFSPYICIKAGELESYYSFFWHDKQSEENIETKIRKVPKDGTTEYLTMY